MRRFTGPRVAIFTDSYYEANGVARTANALQAYAAERNRPMLVVHGGGTTQLVESGSIARLELRRSPHTSFPLEHDLKFDTALWRHAKSVADVLRWFQPDVLHFTGPSDIGLIGAAMAWRKSLPTVGSWHTHVHEYASRRLLRHLPDLAVASRVGASVERATLAAATFLYKLPHVVLAPNAEWARQLEKTTGRPVRQMTRGVDTDFFTPAKRARCDGVVNVGYVGRLAVEKNVRALAAIRTAVVASGMEGVRFTIVGDGAEREWLRVNLPDAHFRGVLRGEALASAYADMDVFAFPSETETVGNVVLEAMASGVPVIAMARGGHRFIAGTSRGALLVPDQAEFVAGARAIIRDGQRRRAMAEAARASMLTRSWEAVFDGLYQAYELACELASGRASSTPALMTVAQKRPA